MVKLAAEMINITEVLAKILWSVKLVTEAVGIVDKVIKWLPLKVRDDLHKIKEVVTHDLGKSLAKYTIGRPKEKHNLGKPGDGHRLGKPKDGYSLGESKDKYDLGKREEER